MRRFIRYSLVLIVLLFSFSCSKNIRQTSLHTGSKSVAQRVVPLVQAHAHNDYAHVHPLFDALDHGFCSIEADIYLLDGKLYVTHDEKDIQKKRTLASLYLDPLQKRIKANGGHVYQGIKQITLFIDIKSDADSTYRVLRKVFKKYKNMLTQFTPLGRKDRAIVVILSGNRPFDLMRNERTRYAACDGRIADLDHDSNVNLVPIISDKWTDFFKWHGNGEMPDDERQRLHQYVKRAHANGQRIRFWSTDTDSLEFQQNLWRELIRADVDLINTDDLSGLQNFLLKKRKRILFY